MSSARKSNRLGGCAPGTHIAQDKSPTDKTRLARMADDSNIAPQIASLQTDALQFWASISAWLTGVVRQSLGDCQT